MSTLEFAEVLTGAVVLLLLGLIVLIWIRRQAISGGKPLVQCALRASEDQPWRLGLLRLGPATLDWYSVAGPSLKPAHSWDRTAVELGAPMATTDHIPGLVNPIVVCAHEGGRDVQLAMAPSAHTAMRSWMESSPPGFNATAA